jgi:hypothetical protein
MPLNTMAGRAGLLVIESLKVYSFFISFAFIFILAVCWQTKFLLFLLLQDRHSYQSAKMGWGVLEDRHMAAPPGTATIGASNSICNLEHRCDLW